MDASTQRPVLIVASGSDGHRQSYVAVLGRWFVEMGHSVVVACGPSMNGIPASRLPMLAQFLAKSGAVAADIESDVVQDPARFRERLTQLETELHPAWTLLVNGDDCVRALRGEWRRKSNQCRRAAIFICFPYEHPSDLREYAFFGKLRPWARQLRERHRQRRFFRREVWSKLGLDLILATDEYAVDALSHPRVHYLPEIYRAWGSDMGPETSEIERARRAYAEFLGRHSGKDVLLYYGGRFLRRGYDTLLALALEYQDTVFVDVGRNAPGENFSETTGHWRRRLASQDRLFQWDIPFLPENLFVDDLFRSTRYVVLPYRHWYGLSGSLFQAASYGRPVLVPDVGYMGTAVRRHGHGLTYRHLDMTSLRRRFDALRIDPARFEEKALQFSRRADEKAIFQAMATSFEPH